MTIYHVSPNAGEVLFKCCDGLFEATKIQFGLNRNRILDFVLQTFDTWDMKVTKVIKRLFFSTFVNTYYCNSIH